MPSKIIKTSAQPRTRPLQVSNQANFADVITGRPPKFTPPTAQTTAPLNQSAMEFFKLLLAYIDDDSINFDLLLGAINCKNLASDLTPKLERLTDELNILDGHLDAIRPRIEAEPSIILLRLERLINAVTRRRLYFDKKNCKISTLIPASEGNSTSLKKNSQNQRKETIKRSTEEISISNKFSKLEPKELLYSSIPTNTSTPVNDADSNISADSTMDFEPLTETINKTSRSKYVPPIFY
ncbi:hypothetical protein CEXT_533631 [Caerostris extrusa]|uniref:Uncharacterized protein n=1 Tax=Caerostris extrusa TaxID=172846 RepID=A0AAV4NPS8_CAEEX|nr:hypothetical protein CEXT_533631 [Caerostris extrusa]